MNYKKILWPLLALILLIILLMCHWNIGIFQLLGLQTTNTTYTWDGQTLSEIENLGLDDTDGDRIPDIYEDTDGDGRLGDDDTDGDGIPDYLDPDDDGDGIPTREEVTDGETFGQDRDGDGIPNYLDTDSDGDGLSDENEGTDDTDGDGIPDYLDESDWESCTTFSYHYCLEAGECNGQFIPMNGCSTECLLLAVIDKEWHSSDCGGESGPREDDDGDDGGGQGQNPKFDSYISFPEPDGKENGVHYWFCDSYDLIWEGEELMPTDETITVGDLRYDGIEPFYFLICNGYDTDIQINIEFTIGCQDTYTGEPMPGYTTVLFIFALSGVLFISTYYKTKRKN